MGAGVIAVSPLAPPPVTQSATNTISTAQVALTSTVDPLTRWSQIAANTGEDIGELADFWMENPAPLARQVVTNLSTYAGWYVAGLQQAIPALQNWAELTMAPAINQAAALIQAGQPEQAGTVLVNALGNIMWAGFPMMNLLSIPGLMTDHFSTLVKGVLSVPTASTLVGLALGVPSDLITSVTVGAQDALDATNSGDLTGAAFAIANIPADIAEKQLKRIFEFRKWGGCGCLVSGGLVLNQLIKLPRQLAAGIALPAPAAASAGTLAIAAPATPELPAVTGTAAQADPEAPAAVSVSSNGVTDLSAGNKIRPGKTGTTSLRQSQKLRASIDHAAGQVDKTLKGIRDNVKKSLKGLNSGADKKKNTAGGATTGGSANGDSDNG
ncbi:hypothetical protein [Mycobacterium sp. NPDC004974]